MNNTCLIEKLNIYLEAIQKYQKYIDNIKKVINKESNSKVRLLMNMALDCCKSGEFIAPKNSLSLEKVLIQLFGEYWDPEEEIDISEEEYFEQVCSMIAKALYKACNHYYLEKNGAIMSPGLQNAYTDCGNYFDKVADRVLNLQRKKIQLDGHVANGAIYYY